MKSTLKQVRVCGGGLGPWHRMCKGPRRVCSLSQLIPAVPTSVMNEVTKVSQVISIYYSCGGV